MSQKEKDIIAMRRAFELARKGIGLVSPNPLVGCVIVSKSGEIVGEGSYTYDRVIHAEAIALAQAAERSQGATAYVTLEPHAHQGKTPPCADALIDAGIARVVAAVEDPNPLVSGRGFARLRERGVKVDVGLLADEGEELNEKFLVWHRFERPFVHLKLAMSLDGRISINSSVSTALSGDAARARVQMLRHEHDAVLVGSGTVLADDPMLTDRSGLARRRPLLRVILDSRLRLHENLKLINTARDVPTLVVTRAENARNAARLRDSGASILEIEEGGRDLASVLRDLRRREIQSVLVEGGSEVAGAFIDQKLVDKVTFITAPLIIGGSDAPPAIGGRGAIDLDHAIKLSKLKIAPLGNDVELTGYPTAA